MTICIATDTLSPRTGGIALFNQHLSSLLAENGHTVILLGVISSDEPDEITAKDSITTVCLRQSYTQQYKKWQAYFSPGSFDAPHWIAAGLAMQHWLKNQNQFQIDLVETPDYGGLAYFLSDPGLPPCIITGHGSFGQLARYNFIRKNDHSRLILSLEEEAFRLADAVITHSALNSQDIHQHYHRAAEQALMPFNLPALPATQDGNDFQVAGGLQPVKGIYTLSEALQILQKENNPVTVQWTGDDTFFAPGQQSMAEHLSRIYPDIWQHQLRWEKATGYEKIIQKIAGCKALLIPAPFETFNYTALEAAAMGKAMIISAGAGVHEYFRHNESAWIIPPDDPKALANAISTLNQSAEHRQQLGQQAKAVTENKLNAAAIIRSRMAVYEKVITKPRKRQDKKELLSAWQKPSRKWKQQISRTLKKLSGR